MRAIGCAVLLAIIVSCTVRYPVRDPTGETFPTVTGQSLEKKPITFPDAVQGQSTVLLIAYEQRGQFDVDRWILGLLQGGLEAPLYELPTIPGAIPGLFANTIDNGMRGGIPEEDWGVVVTMYDDGETIAKFTGNDERRNSTRVMVLDPDGRVAWFHDRGYSARLVASVIAATQTSSVTPR